MAVTPNLVAGSILTAAQVNSYMINSGLVYIKGTTLATTTDITSAFTSDYTSYQLVFDITSAGSGGAATLSGQFLSGTTPLTAGYSYTLSQQSYSSGTFVVSQAAATSFWVVGRIDSASTNAYVTVEINNPAVATEPSQFTARWVDNTTTGNTGGINTSVAAYDGLRVTGWTNPVGTVRVYGRRQA